MSSTKRIKMTRRTLMTLGLAAVTTPTLAGTPINFVPLAAPNTDTSAAGEANNPFLLPPGFSQSKITDRDTLTAAGLPSSFGNWDMVAFGAPENNFGAVGQSVVDSIFIPAEVSNAAGVFRYDVPTGSFVTLMEGIGGGNAAREQNPANFNPLNDEFTRLDPATYTPHNTIITGEETTGGRMFEITNPFAADAAGAGVAWRDNIPAVAHEGLRFDTQGTLYFVDENNSGSIYKFVPKTVGDLSVGQSWVLSVDAYAADNNVDPTTNWDDAANTGSTRTGSATWLPITDADGNAVTATDPFVFGDALVGQAGSTGTAGRDAADELKATPYGRPEDVAIGTLASGSEALYVALTSENTVLTIDLDPNSDGIGTDAMVKEFLNSAVTPDTLGNNPVGQGANDSSYGLDDPDNLAIDADGNIYIIEDENPGDMWRAQDLDGDGVAEAVALWASLGQFGSEPTGLIQDPTDPTRFIVAIQHPSSGNDALWAITTPEPTSAVLLTMLTAGVGSRRRRA